MRALSGTLAEAPVGRLYDAWVVCSDGVFYCVCASPEIAAKHREDRVMHIIEDLLDQLGDDSPKNVIAARKLAESEVEIIGVVTNRA